MNPKDFPLVRDGERTSHAGKAVRNKILLKIPDVEFRLVRQHLEFVELPNHLRLHEPGETVEAAYFPNRGLISIVVAMQDGRNVEAGLVGSEGSVGTALAVGLRMSPMQHVIQVDGDGFRLEREALEELLPSAPQFRYALARYAVVQGMQTAQTAACNRLHDVEQRLARWLLMAQDRLNNGWVGITHDFLATMLGTDRPTVTLAAKTLQDAGAIEYVRAAVKVVDRKKLEEHSCECYGVIQQFNGELGVR
ncbi:MAG TPA: Crp/Fnr family transcriptional regulator [Candidatus Limnocylindrales bacterium]|nr:Crp/Fnr family transcriptional regulator [Candidatus Limnocylindrales bacterium]